MLGVIEKYIHRNSKEISFLRDIGIILEQLNEISTFQFSRLYADSLIF